MRKWTTILGAASVLVLLSGAGCRSKPPTSPPVNTASQPSSVDPLADDLDAAVEDLKVVE